MMHARLAALAVAAVFALAVPCAQQAPTSHPATFQPAKQHGGLLFVSGICPGSSASGFEAEAESALTELRARVTENGGTMDRVLSTSIYLARADDFAALNTVWKKSWPSSPPARTTVVAKLPVPGARVLISAIAAIPVSGRGVERVVVLPKGWVPPANPYSYAILTGESLFLSGLVPRRGADNSLVTGDIETQTNAVLDNAEAILGAAGMSLANVVSARVFLTDGTLFDRMNAAYRTRFRSDPPARATVITPLTSPDYLIEITMVAAKGAERVAVLTPNADGTPGRPNPNLSSAIRVGPRLFLSGMLGVVPGGAPDLAGQTTETLNRLERTMTASGFAWPDVSDAVVYVTDVNDAQKVLEAFGGRVGGAHRLPAGVIVGTGLVSPEGRVEIMLTAGK